MVRRLIWVEELLCSNHNDPNLYIIFIEHFKFNVINVKSIIHNSDVDDMDNIILPLNIKGK